jgi:hypothetical protein
MRVADQLRLTACSLAILSANLPSASADEIGTHQVPGALVNEVPQGAIFGEVTVKGSSCSAADTKPLVREDGKTVTIYFDKFQTEMSESDSVRFADCYISYEIKVPPGYTYAVSQFYYNILGEVRNGVTASLIASYGYEGEGQPAGTVEDLPANLEEQIIRPHAVKHVIATKEWAPCSTPRKLQARVSIRLVNSVPKTFSKLTLVQIDGRNEQEGDGPAVQLQLTWARCPS